MASSSGAPPSRGVPPSRDRSVAGNIPIQPDDASDDRHIPLHSGADAALESGSVATGPRALAVADPVPAARRAPAGEPADAADPLPAAVTSPVPVPPPGGGLLRRHGAFLIVLAVAVAARVTVLLTYPPALLYFGDSPAYLDQASNRLWAGDWRPSGYPMFLRVLGAADHLTTLVIVQHLLTLLAGTALYGAGRHVLARRAHGAVGRGVTSRGGARLGGGWPAALLAAPALLTPWVLDLGQFVLADSLFGAMVLAGMALLAWPGRPSAARFAGAGLLLGASLTVRTVGYGPLGIGALGAAVLAVSSWRLRSRSAYRHGRRHARGLSAPAAAAVVAAFGLSAAAPIVAYSAWSAHQGKGFTVSAHSGFFLYGRVAPFADCSRLPDDPALRSLCDQRPLDERGSPVTYLWPDDSPLRQGNDLVPPGREDLAGEFARQVIREQPWMMVETTARYLGGYFWPVRYENDLTSRADTWELPRTGTNRLTPGDPHASDGYFSVERINDPPAELLSGYSRLAYLPMPAVGVGLLAGVAAAIVGRVRGRAGPGRLFWLAGGAGMSTLVLSSLTSAFDYRYLASVVGLLAPAAIAGAAALVRVLRASPAGDSRSALQGGTA